MKPQHYENIDQRTPEEIALDTEQSILTTCPKKPGEDVMRIVFKDQREPEEIAIETPTNTLYS